MEGIKMVSPIPDKSEGEYKEILDYQKSQLKKEVSHLSNEKVRQKRTNISSQSLKTMQDGIMKETGVDELITGKRLTDEVNKWAEWQNQFESAEVNQDGSRKRPALPQQFKEKSITDRLIPPPIGRASQARSEINPHKQL